MTGAPALHSRQSRISCFEYRGKRGSLPVEPCPDRQHHCDVSDGGCALAVALLENRGFTEEDFARSHPGGSLGRRLLLRVEDLMHTGEQIPRKSVVTLYWPKACWK